jgi:hypothetical protein
MLVAVPVLLWVLAVVSRSSVALEPLACSARGKRKGVRSHFHPPSAPAPTFRGRPRGRDVCSTPCPAHASDPPPSTSTLSTPPTCAPAHHQHTHSSSNISFLQAHAFHAVAPNHPRPATAHSSHQPPKEARRLPPPRSKPSRASLSHPHAPTPSSPQNQPPPHPPATPKSLARRDPLPPQPPPHKSQTFRELPPHPLRSPDTPPMTPPPHTPPGVRSWPNPSNLPPPPTTHATTLATASWWPWCLRALVSPSRNPHPIIPSPPPEN